MNANDFLLPAAGRPARPDRPPRNFVEHLDRLAAERADTPWLTVVDEVQGQAREAVFTYGEFAQRVRALAARLQQQFAAGERALVLLDNDEHYAVSMLACFHSGVIAVPVFPPESRRPQHLARLQGIARDSGAACVLTTAALQAQVRPDFHPLEVIAVDAVDAALASAWQPRVPQDADIAFLQYTSGSTGSPKGVMVTHGNLMANERAIQEGMDIGPEDLFVSWAPLFHDMGLIGGLLQPLYSGASLVLVSPRYFLERPVRWLDLVSRFRATVSGGPDFSYRLCLERIGEAQSAGLDLSHWRVAYSGAEPVRADTMVAFSARFAPQGFDAGAVHACYGLAEATLYVTGSRRGRGLWTRGFSPEALSVGAVTPDCEGSELVGCGAPAKEHAVLIVDVPSQSPADPGCVGEIWAGGPSVAAGYWGKPQETAETFVERDGRRWLRTGDLGFLHEGQLVVTGRMKDLIILRGHNIYPQDVERLIEAEVEAVRKGRVAVFSVQSPRAEGIGAAVEVSRGMQKLVPPPVLVDALSAAVSETVGEPLSVVLLLEPGTLPKTTSGKLQRSACQAAWKAHTADAYAIYEWGRFVRGGLAEPEAATGRPLDGMEADMAAIWREVLRVGGDRPLDRDAHFFVLGGNSLAATQAAARIGQRWGVAFAPRVLFDHPRLQPCCHALRELLDGGKSSPSALAEAPVVPLSPAQRAVPQPLSPAQARQWFLWKMAPAQTAYHLGLALRLQGELDGAVLYAALCDTVARHASLRTTFGEDAEGVPFQQIADGLPGMPWETHDIGELASGPREAALRTGLDRLRSVPFELLDSVPWRAALWRLDARTHVVAVVMHHILSDGTSMPVWAQEFLQAYGARRDGAGALPAVPAVQYIDYVAWSRARLESGEGDRQWAWWQGRLAGITEPCEIRPDRPRPPRALYTARRHDFAVPPATLQHLQALGAREGVTPFMALLAALHALLHRYTGQRRVRVGAAVAQRGRPEFERLIGLFVNTLVLPATVDGRMPLLQVLRDARELVLGAQAHQELPFDRLVEGLRPERSASLSPLFQVMLNHLAEDTRMLHGVPGLAVEAEPLQGSEAQFELVLEAREGEGGALSLAWVYAGELFEPASIERLAGHYLIVLEALAQASGETVGDVDLLPPQERARIVEWSCNPLRESAPRSVVCSLEAHAARQPQATALLFGDEVLSYAALNERANRLAHHLLRHGLSGQALVGIAMERSAEMVVAMLAVMKTGGAYLPLDPDYPADRLAYMLQHSGAAWVLTHAAAHSCVPQVPGVRTIAVDRTASGTDAADALDPRVEVHGEQLAYVIYTSGSTGRPKGVAVRHAALHTCMAWMQSTYGLAPGDTVLHKAPFGFDVSCWEIFWPLTAGARLLVAPPGAHRDPEQLVALIERHQVTTLNFVPSMLQAFLDHPGIEHRTRLRHVICGGEAMPATLQREALRRLQGATLQNLYGPTETTIHVTRWTCRDEDGPVPIGRPISETQAWVLDPDLNPVPQGVAGELYIGGALLARGYLGQPGLTAERFVAHPLAAGDRLYRTGDLVLWNAGGQIEYLGRIDHQVKLRGLRIELGEIEAALRAQGGVRDAVAVVRTQAGNDSLVAYVAGTGEPAALRAALASRLPDYMVPRAMVVLDALPLNANGKVDRAALPPPDLEGAGGPAALPEGGTAQRLAALWGELLGTGSVGLHDNFFDLGGHSLLMIRAHRMLQDRWGTSLTLVDLFRHPTVESLARRIDQQTAGGDPAAAHSPPSPQADDRARRQRAALLQRRAHLQGIQE